MQKPIAPIILGIICGMVGYTYTQQSRCSIDKFRCANGQCISSNLLCDGKAHCKDQSDETNLECHKPGIICPDYAFRCAYGACVDGDKICNGIKDCIDNSDETLPTCSNDVSNNKSELCLTDQFKCTSGQCISSKKLCDGTADCTDRSDETFLQCGTFFCSELLFKCTYGACIKGDYTCNGVADCVDNSDEDPRLCNREQTSTSTRPLYTSTSTRPLYTYTERPVVTTSTDRSLFPISTSKCRAPPQPQNGYRKLHKSQCYTGEDCEIESGVTLDKGSYLIYTCNNGYELQGSKDVICTPEGKWVTIPVCKEIRCRALDTSSRSANCAYFSEAVDCFKSAVPHTKATLACKPGYKEDRTSLTRQRTVTCNEHGIWEPDPINCISECGKPYTHATPLVVHGFRANITEFPWHASLYVAKSRNADAPKSFICGATIFKENLLITAAHCVPNSENPSKYYVATGNIFQAYDSPFHNPKFVKKAQVQKIYIPTYYYGVQGLYESDIAILEISPPFVFSSLLLPACIDIDVNNDFLVFQEGSLGKVAGFGRTEVGDTSFNLQAINIPYVPPAECFRESQNLNTQHFITVNKFCGGYLNGSSVCDGDSGSGLVFNTGGLWYLRGIVSISLGVVTKGGSTQCKSNSYTLFTRVSSHISWIQDISRKYIYN